MNVQTTDSEVEHFEDVIVLRHEVTWALGNFARGSFPATQVLELNEDNDKVEALTEYWDGKPLLRFKGILKACKYFNGNGATRVVFGLASGRFIE